MNFNEASMELRIELENNSEVCWALKLGLFEHAAILSEMSNIVFVERTSQFVSVRHFQDPYFGTIIFVGW